MSVQRISAEVMEIVSTLLEVINAPARGATLALAAKEVNLQCFLAKNSDI